MFPQFYSVMVTGEDLDRIPGYVVAAINRMVERIKEEVTPTCGISVFLKMSGFDNVEEVEDATTGDTKARLVPRSDETGFRGPHEGGGLA